LVDRCTAFSVDAADHPQVTAERLGPGQREGLAFYSDLVDACWRRISTAVTLYHGELPQAWEDPGGWTARAKAERVAE